MNLRLLSAFTAGLIFGLGLIVSGMANPEKVLSFLDLAGAWDPSLALVMGAAVAVTLPVYTYLKQRSRDGNAYSLLGHPLDLPTRQTLDRRLILGSLGFGAGWGLAGFCPGPALVVAAMGEHKAVLFVAAMLAGMLAYEMLERRHAAQR